MNLNNNSYKFASLKSQKGASFFWYRNFIGHGGYVFCSLR